MKTVGFLGGMSSESTLCDYRKSNRGVRKRLGGLHSAEIAMYRVDCDPIERLQHAGDRERTAALFLSRQKRLRQPALPSC